MTWNAPLPIPGSAEKRRVHSSGAVILSTNNAPARYLAWGPRGGELIDGRYQSTAPFLGGFDTAREAIDAIKAYMP